MVAPSGNVRKVVVPSPATLASLLWLAAFTGGKTMSLVCQRQKLSTSVSVHWKVYTARSKPDAINHGIAEAARCEIIPIVWTARIVQKRAYG